MPPVQVTPPSRENVQNAYYRPLDLNNGIQRAFGSLAASLDPIQKSYEDDIQETARVQAVANAKTALGQFAVEYQQRDPADIIQHGLNDFRTHAEQYAAGLSSTERDLISRHYPLMVADATTNTLQGAYRQQDAVTRENFNIALRDYVASAPSASPAELASAESDLRTHEQIAAKASPGVDFRGLVDKTVMVAHRSRQQADIASITQVAYADPKSLEDLRAASASDLPTFQARFGSLLTERDQAAVIRSVRAIDAYHAKEQRQLDQLTKAQDRASIAGLRSTLKTLRDQRDAERNYALNVYNTEKYTVGVQLQQAEDAIAANPMAQIGAAALQTRLESAYKSAEKLATYDTKPNTAVSLPKELLAEVANTTHDDRIKEVMLPLAAAESGGRLVTGDGGLAKGYWQVHPEVAAAYGGTNAEAVGQYLSDLYQQHDGDWRGALAEFHWGVPAYTAMEAGKGITIKRNGQTVTLSNADMRNETEQYLGKVLDNTPHNAAKDTEQLNAVRDRINGITHAQEFLRENPDPSLLQQHIDSGAVPPNEVGAWSLVMRSAAAQMRRDPNAFLASTGHGPLPELYANPETVTAAWHQYGGLLPQQVENLTEQVKMPGAPVALAVATQLPWNAGVDAQGRPDGPRADLVSHLMRRKAGNAQEEPVTSAMIGSLVMGAAPNVARDAEIGIKAYQQQHEIWPGRKALADRSDYARIVKAARQDPSLGVGTVGFGDAIADAATAVYLGRGYRMNDDGTFAEGSQWDKALADVLGSSEPTRFRGRDILWPRDAPFTLDELYGQTQNPLDIESRRSEGKPTQFDRYFANVKFNEAQRGGRSDWELIQSFSPVWYGPGQYAFARPGEGLLPAKTGGPFILDLNR